METLKEISFGETTIKDQRVEMKGVVMFSRSQSNSREIETEEEFRYSFFQKKFDIKLLKINMT